MAEFNSNTKTRPATIVGMNGRNNLRIPPQSLEAEAALLGSIMQRPDAMYELMDIVSADSFYSERHRLIFATMMDLFKKSNPIDLLSVSARLREREQLEQVGGGSYLAELIQSVPSSSNAKYYAEIVQKKYMMRRLIEASEHIGNLGYEESLELEEILDKAEKKVFDVTNYSSTHKFIEIKDELMVAAERMEKLHSSGEKLRGVPTGFAELDNKLSGFQPSDLIILAARPSMGKTSLALDIARMSAVNHGTPVGIFSLEMSAQQLVDRMLASHANVDAWKLRTGRLDMQTEFGTISSALDTLSKAPIYIDDQPGNNILKMRAIARRLKSEKGLKLLIVDYLQLMVPTQSRNSDNVVQQVTEISRSLKNLARELDVPVIALSQLSRAVEQRGGRPRLSDLRDSGSIEQDADIVMFIHREDKYKEQAEKNNIAEILIEKHRNGEVGKVELYFNDKKVTFQSLQKGDFGGAEKEFASF